jgi:hypothetical protein
VSLGKVFSSLVLTAAGIVVASGSASAAGIGFTPLSAFNDNDFRTAKCETPSSSCTPTFEEDFVYEGRFANNSLNGNIEMFINDWNTNQGPAVPAAQAQYKWSSGQPVPFTLRYDGTTGSFNANSVLGGNTTISAAASTLTESSRFADKPLNAMYVRTRSNSDTGQSGSSMTLSNIKVSVDGGVNFTAYSGSIAANDSDPLEYLLITGLNQNFVVMGDATFVKGSSSRIDLGSRIAFEFKAGWLEPPDEAPTTPEPASMSLLSLALVGAVVRKRRQK